MSEMATSEPRYAGGAISVMYTLHAHQPQPEPRPWSARPSSSTGKFCARLTTAAPTSSSTDAASSVAFRPSRSSRLPLMRSAPAPATKLRPEVAASCSIVDRLSDVAMSRRLPLTTPTS